ncbi:MAG: Flp family type IVb pilin [Bryobacteraceae bacterium]
MRRWLQTFSSAESGQDLIEYSLLIAFIALATAAVMANVHTSVNGIVDTTNSNLSAAGSVANAGG